ncbi:hypothetical protein [Prosthecobacter sp.]|uniref:hypothetical protein n=1 Tax=Prosthecobacter sp. TaxID=1965333 RepID=UPI003783CEE7
MNSFQSRTAGTHGRAEVRKNEDVRRGLRGGLCVVAALLLGACVNSHETRPFTVLPGSMNATVISKGGGTQCSPGGRKARPGDNCTGIRVQAGRCYLFQAQPSADFADSTIKLTNLDGWDFPLLQPLCFLKRSPARAFFTLIGTIDGRHAFRIREGMRWQAPASGELVCYVNDWFFKYGNNLGSIRLQVTACPAHGGGPPKP